MKVEKGQFVSGAVRKLLGAIPARPSIAEWRPRRSKVFGTSKVLSQTPSDGISHDFGFLR